MAERTLFCFGYGYTATALARRLRGKSRIIGTTTGEEKARIMRAEGVEAIVWKDREFDPSWLDAATHILISTPPGDNGCPTFLAASHAIAVRANKIRWLSYLSSNVVYGDYHGAWVDETYGVRATSDRGRLRILAETDWFALAEHCDLPLIVFRLPGIYGPGRSALDTVRRGKAKRIYKKGQVFNRIHVDDIAATLAASIEKPRVHNLYNLADDEPAPPQDVIEYACKLLGVAPPPLVPIEEASLSDMAKSFYADNKRVSNQRMKSALNIQLAYPNYRVGLRGIFDVERKK